MSKIIKPTRHRRGDVSPQTGLHFWQYGDVLRYPNGEYWVSRERFETLLEAQKRNRESRKHDYKAHIQATQLKRGDLDPATGKVFSQYAPTVRGFEIWLSPEEFTAHKAKKALEAKLRYRGSPKWRLENRLRCRLNQALRGKGLRVASALELVGCTLDQLAGHLEFLFEEGMTWDNYGEWEIDHIHPVNQFDLSNPELQKICFHYLNLRPLWKEENVRRPRGPRTRRPVSG